MTTTGYFGEFVRNGRALTAASLGLIAGTISNYISSLFAPALLETFGWAKSQFALVGLTVVIAAIALPIVGRLADRHGMRRIACIGVVGLPLVFCGLAFQNGDFITFFLLSLAQMLIISALAGIVVYNRLIVRSFDRATGLALGIASCMPALAAALVTPLLSDFMDAYGWRAGYFFMAGFTALLGGAALLTVPAGFNDRGEAVAVQKSAQGEYQALLRDRSFIIIFGAMLLCNLHFTMQTTQLKLIVLDIGVSSVVGSAMISIFAVGVIIGRIACGLALDRFPPRLVAAACFLIPAIGLGILSTAVPSVALVGFAVGSLGFSLGAEGDIAAYLVTRYFEERLFSTVLGLVASAMAISAFVGSLVLSRTVAVSGGYSLFLAISSATLLLGSLSFLLLRSRKEIVRETVAVASS